MTAIERAQATEGASVVYLGPDGTFTHQAACDLARPGDELVPLATAEAVVRAVEDGSVPAGVIAFENSHEGTVGANLDELLVAAECVIAAERVLPVSFSLLRAPGEEVPLRGVASHPFALAQCSRLIAELGLETRETASTAAACRDVEPGWGALAPAIAGTRFGLRTERAAVEDVAGAATRFVLLRRTVPPATGRDRSAFAVRPRQDEPGSLVAILQEFSLRGINLTAIKSRPAKSLLGEYAFFVECEGHIHDVRVRDAVIGLLGRPDEVRFLGSFAEDPSRPPHPAAGEDDRRTTAYEAMSALVEPG